MTFLLHYAGADPTMQDDNGHTADEYTENQTIKKLINANKNEVMNGVINWHLYSAMRNIISN